MSGNPISAWRGYLRQNGSKGIRNKILVMYTVECASFVAKEIGSSFRNSEIDVDVVGFAGCTDNEYALRMMIALLRHPNVGAVLTVGLGCEYLQGRKLAEIARQEGKPADWMLIQDRGGTLNTIEAGKDAVRKLHDQLQRETVMTEMNIHELIVGAECGGSDYTSGLSGNVVVGRLFDKLVEAGGTAIFEEIVEAIGLKEIMLGRAANESARADLGAAYDKMLDYCKSVRQYSVSPGNFAGGLTTIEEKSMGAFAKSGTKPIEGVLRVSQTPPNPGLWLLDSTPDPYFMGFGYTNPNDSEGLMDLVCSGCHLLFLVTGRGTVVGSAVSPVIKVTGNENTFRRMSGDLDFCSGAALTGEKTMDELAAELLGLVVQACQGQLTKAELLNHKEYFIPYKYQSTGKNCEV
ncbi:UxaA family hydrolase [Paenibacillus sp. N4]|uniref:UxaA family hydrolase n=1 Tax=Paenibacillus vietnamensis TaxID=2590547 RepID=UPI001CD0C965|nr:UxaA family hydrolase [Paenibacillus vietnamensis]MCA0754192.1 UxaA family hydrolase [Paenibacillus vietnamensis]